MKSIIIIAAFLLMPFLTAEVSYSADVCNCCVECSCSNCNCSDGACTGCESCDCCTGGCCTLTGDAQGNRKNAVCRPAGSINTGREITKAGEDATKNCCAPENTESHKH